MWAACQGGHMGYYDRMPNSSVSISSVEWLPASFVLASEALHFTPWLAANLELLGRALGLEELELVGTEHDVLDKRLDILASAVDLEGGTVPVVVENQYGRTDHGHLGQLLTYLAQQGRGYAVWVTEEVHDAHLSAINFLNKATVPEVGFFLVRVRFTHSRDNVYQVHFEVVARPNAFDNAGKRSSAARKATPRYEYGVALLTQLEEPLKRAGFANTGVHVSGYVWARWPDDLWFTPVAHRTAFIRPQASTCQVRVRISRAGSKEANDAVLLQLRDAYAAEIQSLVAADDVVDWEAAQAGAESSSFVIGHASGGYLDGDPEATAAWAQRVLAGVLGLLRSAPLDLEVHSGSPDHEVEQRPETVMPSLETGLQPGGT